MMGAVTDESTELGRARDRPTPRRPSRRTAAAAARRLRLLLSVAAVVLALDIVTKVLAVKLLTPGQPVSIIGDTVTWTLVRNSGAAFSMATGYTWVLTLIATGVVIGIIWMGRRLVSPWWALGLGMILGGALGQPGGPVLPVAGAAAGPRRGLPVGRLVAGVQRRRPGGGGRGDPAGRCCRCSASTSTPGGATERDGAAGATGGDAGEATADDDRSMPVPEGLAGMRVDAGLARLLGLSRTAAAALAEDGGVELDGVAGRQVRPAGRRAPGCEVRLPEAPAPLENTPVDIEGMTILYSDDDIVAVDKPAGVAAHASVGLDRPDGARRAGRRRLPDHARRGATSGRASCTASTSAPPG